jgi:hypothetical protein
MNNKVTFTTKLRFRAGRNGRKHLETGDTPRPTVESGRVPLVSKLMALAIRFDGLVREGVVTDQAELARLGHVSRARLTQIMNLLLLAPDVQEELLHLPRTERGKDPIPEWRLRAIAAEPDWRKQRQMWQTIQNEIAEK